MLVSKMFRNIFLLPFSLALCSSSSLPGWNDLECEEGHKYLFSDDLRTWHDARDECELYGGWLVDINSQREQNCLVRFAHSADITSGRFWHDGIIFYIYLFWYQIIYSKPTISLMKEFLSTPRITLTSLGSPICLIVMRIIWPTVELITTHWVCLDKVTKGQDPGVI